MLVVKPITPKTPPSQIHQELLVIVVVLTKGEVPVSMSRTFKKIAPTTNEIIEARKEEPDTLPSLELIAVWIASPLPIKTGIKASSNM